MAGGARLANRAGVTTLVAHENAGGDGPPLFAAVTATRTVAPTSAADRTKLSLRAPPISPQTATFASQRHHW
jgi:hypothetical protein